jgi:sigma-B regulation protein RsbU (phosphoserine phosphatase)
VAFWVIGPLEKLIYTAKRWTARDFSARAPFSGPSDIQVVAREFNSMAEDLEAHEQRRQQELEEARDIQTDLLPKFPPEVGGLRLAAEYRPATHVAGDLYDVFALPGGRIALAVLDVSGHGISAAMLTGVAKISLRRCLTEYSNLSKALKHVNADILACTSESYFVTACVGIWNPHDSRWTYCAAGHPGGVLIHHGQVRELPSTAPLLGILPDCQWETDSLVLAPKDRIFLYTDGIVEAEIGDQQFGLEGLNVLLTRTCHLDLREQAQAVIAAVSQPDSGQLCDDATIFAFEFHAAAPASVSVTS